MVGDNFIFLIFNSPVYHPYFITLSTKFAKTSSNILAGCPFAPV